MKYVEKGVVVKGVYECETRINFTRGKSRRVERRLPRTLMLKLVAGYDLVAMDGGRWFIGKR